MPAGGRVIFAVFKREFFSYFSNPTGYVFITLFVFLSAMAAFWQERFFQNNLANLDPLNQYFPYLLVFLIPAITMGLWAEERKQGTEELLLTLPAGDAGILLGKYFAALGIYTVALIFSLSHVVVLLWLGSPDGGMVAATYFGYWLAGAALLPLGLLASQLTDNLTVAFILGSMFCAVPVFLRHAGSILSGRWQRLAEQLSVVEQFGDLTRGVVTASAVAYFTALAGAVLYVGVALVGRRRWSHRPAAPRLGAHYLARGVSLVLVAASLTVLASAVGGRADVTSESVHSLSEETRKLIGAIDPKRPVFIQAYLSPEVPRGYLQVRQQIASFLRDYAAFGKERIQTRIVETVKYSPEAREARERYRINPFRVPATEESASAVNEIFLGLVFTSGSEEFVIPFFDRGLPVEYELTRSIRVVSRARRKKIGVLATGAKLFGGFDFQSRAQTNDWSIIAELKKQYEVEPLTPDSDYPGDIDVLVAALPTTLTTPQLERLTAYVKKGQAALVLVDPLPAFNLNLSPAAADPVAAQNPFQPAPPPPTPSADVRGLMAALGVEWVRDRLVWDQYNPHPQLRVPPEIVFVGKGSQSAMPFQTGEEITSGLQEVVLLYPGALKPRADGRTRFVPLLSTGKSAGTLRWDQLVQRTMFGMGLAQNLPHNSGAETHVLAARVTRKPPGEPLNAIVIADVDLMGEEFFDLRRRGIENLNFDNVTLVLNAVDELAGDRSFIALRKRRPSLRTLEALERRTQVYEQKRAEETQQAQGVADRRLREAQARLDAAVRELEARRDLDDQTRQIMISNLQAAENRRLAVARANIEDERQRQIENARAGMEASVRAIQRTIKLLAVSLPPVPAFLLFVAVSARKLRRERSRISIERLIEKRR